MRIVDRMLDVRADPSPVSAAGKLWRRLSEHHASEENAVRELSPSAAIWQLPTKQELRDLLQQAFLASMEREESRPVRALFEFASEIPGSTSREDFVLIDPAVPFRTADVRRLAPAVDPGTTSMLVRRSNGIAPLEIWGLIHRGTKEVNSRLIRAPAGLSVEVWDTGALDLRIRTNLVYSFVRGRSVLPGSSSPESVADLVGRVLHQAEEPDEHAFHYGTAIGRVADRILRAHHGGAIFVSTLNGVPDGIDLHRPCSGPATTGLSRMTRLIREHRVDHRIEWHRSLPIPVDTPIADSPVAVANHFRIERQYNEELDFVARLAAVDGAVLLDRKANVLGFGAFFSGRLEGESQVLRIRLGQPVGQYVDVAACGGTRHRSAVRFCQDHPAGAAAIVISHDGGLSVATKNGANLSTELHDIY